MDCAVLVGGLATAILGMSGFIMILYRRNEKLENELKNQMKNELKRLRDLAKGLESGEGGGS